MEVSNNLIKELEQYADEEDTSIWADCDIEGYEDFHKDNEDSKIWWTGKIDIIGELNISFDRKKFTTCSKIIHTICLKKKLKYLKKKSHIGQISLLGERKSFSVAKKKRQSKADKITNIINKKQSV